MTEQENQRKNNKIKLKLKRYLYIVYFNLCADIEYR